MIILGMRKVLVLVLLLLSAAASYAQDSTISQIFPMKDGMVEYERVIIVDSATKDQLFTKAKVWAISHYKSQKDASQSDDPQLGLLAFTGFFEIPFTAPKTMGVEVIANRQYWHTLKIYVKDNRAKIVIDNIKLGLNSTEKTSIETSTVWPKNMPKKYKEGSEYHRAYMQEARNNFILANIKFENIVSSLEQALKSKGEFDF